MLLTMCSPDVIFKLKALQLLISDLILEVKLQKKTR